MTDFEAWANLCNKNNCDIYQISVAKKLSKYRVIYDKELVLG